MAFDSTRRRTFLRSLAGAWGAASNWGVVDASSPPVRTRTFTLHRRPLGRIDDGNPERAGKAESESDADPRERWERETIPYEAPPALESVQRGFDAWTGVDGIPTFERVADSKNTVRFGKLEGRETAVARTTFWFRPDERVITRFEMVVDVGERWATFSPEGSRATRATQLDLQSAIAHEAGHVVGLTDRYDDSLRTMYASIAYGETVKRTPTAEDVAEASDRYR